MQILASQDVSRFWVFEGPFRMGDRIQIGDHYGEVVDYGFRTLRLRTPDDNTVAIPHSVVWTDPVSNANSGQLERQLYVFRQPVAGKYQVQMILAAALSVTPLAFGALTLEIVDMLPPQG